MASKFSKFLLFTATTAAAAAGIYYYMQKKNENLQQSSIYDDDEFDDFEDEPDADPTKNRSYVSLNVDNVESFASEAFQRAKEKITDSYYQVKDTVRAGFEGAAGGVREFVDISRDKAEEIANKAENISKNAANNMGDLEKDIAGKAEEVGKDAVHFADKATDAAKDSLDDAKETLDKANESIAHVINEGVTKVEDFFDEDE
ncbi:MAG: hypothetical protein FWC09_04975 [Lachnospiraceae bacterium]|nr:hypothetical protein [Lachnospiraceae bacterium]